MTDTIDLQRQLDDARARITSLEAELAEARRWPGGVAHDFGNVLAAIAGYNDLMLRSLASGSPLRRGAESIQKAVESGQRLARQLLTVGRAPNDRTCADLNVVVAGVVRTLTPILGQRIDVDLRFGSEVGTVGIAAAALEQVAMNLILNARDAMPSGGRVTVSTALTPGNGQGEAMATLSVEDTGLGMDEATRARVFEPYFTTKEAGRGTGLGLSTVLGILAQHGGRVEVSSEPGQGSTFRVCLPAAGPPSAAAAPVTTAPPTLLVVEDEPGVGDVIVEILEMHGYRTLRAVDAEEALGVCARDPGGIALVVADVDAPGVAGPDFAEWLRAIAPHAKLLRLSGDPVDGDTPAFLPKPFAVDALVETVRGALGPPATTG